MVSGVPLSNSIRLTQCEEVNSLASMASNVMCLIQDTGNAIRRGTSKRKWDEEYGIRLSTLRYVLALRPI